MHYFSYMNITPAFNYTLKASVILQGQHYDLSATLLLLNEIEKQGNLTTAAKKQGYSYRKAWNLIKQIELLFAQQLVEKYQGKGTRLSPLGQLLLQQNQQINNQFQDSLLKAEHTINDALKSTLENTQALKIIASDCEKLEQIRQSNQQLEIHIDGSGQALSAYANGRCELAGFHIAMSENNEKQIKDYCQYLDPKQDQFVILEQRQQGLISHPERPVHSIQQISEQKLTFVNRQVDSGTRLLLDTLLKAHKIKPEQINGYFHEEHTHLAVASMVSSRQADVGLAVKNVATRLQLHFTPVNNELYFFVFKTLTAKIKRVLDQLKEQKSLEILDYNTFLERIS